MNIALIGMPGSGKSTIGFELAKLLNYAFFDVDKLIEATKTKPLQTILGELGDEDFIALEEKTVLMLNPARAVLSPGGSVVYSKPAMRHLRKISKIVFINVPLGEIKNRIADIDARGIVGLKSKTIDELFEERLPLYKRYADFTITVRDNSDAMQAAKSIQAFLF